MKNKKKENFNKNDDFHKYELIIEFDSLEKLKDGLLVKIKKG